LKEGGFCPEKGGGRGERFLRNQRVLALNPGSAKSGWTPEKATVYGKRGF